MVCPSWLTAFALSFVLELTHALPQWDGFWGTTPQISIGSLVPGATVIEAISEGIDFSNKYNPKYLSIPTSEKGVPGPATIFENTSPPLFYIHNGQLWQPTNLTSILRVNVLNVTQPAQTTETRTQAQAQKRGPTLIHPAPLKLELSEEVRGVEGTWHWRGTRLYFDMGNRSNKGLFFQCVSPEGLRGVYTSLEDVPAPPGCKFLTLHSFADRPGLDDRD